MFLDQTYFNGIVFTRDGSSWIRLRKPNDAENVSPDYDYAKTLRTNIRDAKAQHSDYVFRYMVFDSELSIPETVSSQAGWLFDTTKLVRIKINNRLQINGQSINAYFSQYIGKYLFLIVER